MAVYFVFAGDDYYPLRGIGDYVGLFDDPGAAVVNAPRGRDWVQVAEFDGTTLVVVAEIEHGNIQVYPNRMAHQRAARAASGQGE